MKTRLNPINKNEKSIHVSVLHKAMKALGYTVPDSEMTQRKAGVETMKRIKVLQRRHNIEVTGNELVNEDTLNVIKQALKEKGLLTAENSFTIKGRVAGQTRRVRKNQRLMVYDLDLKAIGLLEKAKTLKDLDKKKGFEFIGETTSNNKGFYKVTFYKWQYERNAENMADVVVLAVDDTEIIGRSRMIDVDDFADKGFIKDVNILVNIDNTRSEYEHLKSVIEPYFEGQELSVSDIATSADQLAFVSKALNVSQGTLLLYAQAEHFLNNIDASFGHDLLYAVGRQKIKLSWKVLHKKKRSELVSAIEASVQQNIIAKPKDASLKRFFRAIRSLTSKSLLDTKLNDGSSLDSYLSSALKNRDQKESFLDALHSFDKSDYSEFWTKHLPKQAAFKNKPKLIESLQQNQRLTVLTANNTKLVEMLMNDAGATSVEKLMSLPDDKWIELAKEAGVPNGFTGDNEAIRLENYTSFMKQSLNAAFPTKRIALEVKTKGLPGVKAGITRKMLSFFKNNPDFDFATSRVVDFEDQINAIGGQQAAEVKDNLTRIERLYQVSIDPESVGILMQENFSSARAIADVPEKAFISNYSGALGGETQAFAIHQRASYVSTKIDLAAANIKDHLGLIPEYILPKDDGPKLQTILDNHLPNWRELFGSPDICECEHCRSIYSPAAYFVDILRFLWRGETNSQGKSPLDILETRRPDLLHLGLTCENSHTVIPYIDLVNEILEFYTANNSLNSYKGYDTGDTTSEELRANPQNLNMDAYEILSDEVYPFTLPYHQPLDTIRTYSNHLKTSRHDLIEMTRKDTAVATDRALAAERLGLSPKDYEILTGRKIGGANVNTPVHRYYGYTLATQMENAAQVQEFLERSGIAYTDLVDLLETNFINPNRGHLEFLEAVFATATISANDLYNTLKSIHATTTTTAAETAVKNALSDYNTAHGTSISNTDFDAWVIANFTGFQEVITLYEPESKCSLDTTSLKTLKSLYEGDTMSGISTTTWQKIHRFIRLWRKLDWSIQEVDIVLTALGFSDFSTTVISQLSAVLDVVKDTKLSPEQVAVFWGDINTLGDKSLYQKLFLNKAAQTIHESFEADQWGHYLQDTTKIIADHKDSILAAFRITEDELNGIFNVAQLIDASGAKSITENDVLSLPNLSQLYRHVLLAKSLKIKVLDLVTLIQLFGAEPFSYYNTQTSAYEHIDAAETREVIQLFNSVKPSGFKADELNYVVNKTVAADSKIGLDTAKALQAVKDLRGVFDTIELEHPEVPEIPLTLDDLTNKLLYTFQEDSVTELRQIMDGSVVHEVITDANLTVVISDELSPKYVYIKGSGRLIANGVMTSSERTKLKALTNANANFKSAVDALYNLPDDVIIANFSGIFSEAAETRKILLDRPPQGVNAATLDDKIDFVYAAYLPGLKSKLRRDALTQHMASLIGVEDDITTLLVENSAANIIAQLTETGYSATYYSDNAFGTAVHNQTETSLDHDWGTNAPAPGAPTNNFSARWEAYLAPPASDSYTLQVNVHGADESFKMYLDDELILEKAAADTTTSWEVIAELNAALMPRIRLDYIDASAEASIQLLWKTDGTALEAIPSEYLYPTSPIDTFLDDTNVLNCAALFSSNFELSTTELDHFLKHAANFGGIDFFNLNTAHWKTVRDYKTLVESVPQSQAFLTDVFELANANPAPAITEVTDTLLLATAWEETSLNYLINDHFGLTINDFKNADVLNQLLEIMSLVNASGISAATLCTIGTVEVDFNTLAGHAQLLKNAVRAKYDESTWMDLASDLNDILREHQKDALIAYILQRPEIKAAGIYDGNGLFEYFLIDVEMSACMDTSRIVQANNSIQQFVTRCQLNLESNRTTGNERGVSPSAIDGERWSWMKNYRVWEANRKVFVTPENWLEPEWRMNRSEFFKELESHLLQNDITDRSVEEGLRNYVARVNEVANLEVCGSYRELYEDESKLKYLHVFARTNTAPYKYFYRRWDEYEKWSAWETVQADIRSVNADNAVGVHLLPVVWKDRLFLFWPEFLEKTVPAGDSSESFQSASNDTISSREPFKYWEVTLAWTEYVDEKWTPKEVSSAFLTMGGGPFVTEKIASLSSYINTFNQELTITLWHNQSFAIVGDYKLTDIRSPITATNAIVNINWGATNYFSDFQKRARTSKFELNDYTYIQRTYQHTLLGPNNLLRLESNLDAPFFYTADKRTYFVKPKTITFLDRVTNPGWFEPILPPIEPIFPIDPIDPFDPPIDPIDPFDPIGPFEPGNPRFPVFPDQPVVNPGDIIFDPGTGFGGDMQPFEYVLTGGVVQPGHVMDHDEYMVPVNYSTDMQPQFKTMKQKSRSMAMMSVDPGYLQLHVVPHAFGGVIQADPNITLRPLVVTKGLEFHTFYHPYSSEYVRNLNRGGITRGEKASTYPPGLMESDTTLSDDKGATFISEYNPNFNNNLVFRPDLNDPKRTYFKENVCFDVYGANSIYNWELFFHAPLYIATRLTKNGKYEAAMNYYHLIFKPITDELPKMGEPEVARYWQVPPFKTELAQSMEDWFRDNLDANSDTNVENSIIGEWRDNPFDPHLVASNRPLAYMKHVVIKYVENLLEWGDSLFRQHSMESVNQALQIYVIANHILGKRPEFVPKRGTVKAETYTTLIDKWDDFSNALVELENIFPYSSSVPVTSTDSGINLLGLGSTFYFCIPSNEKLIHYWDTVEDRLYKIRHCLDINGVESKLALFSPPIDPAALINAAAKGLSLGSILADLSSPGPIYRFTYLVQKSNEFCSDVKTLGTALLTVLEKKDAEALSMMRASHETTMQELITAIKERNVLDAKANKENLEAARTTAIQRQTYYTDLLGADTLTDPGAPSVSVSLTVDSALPATTNIPELEPDVDVSLADTDEGGVKLIPKEQEELDRQHTAAVMSGIGSGIDALAGLMNFIPNFSGEMEPIGTGASVSFGGSNVAGGLSGVARVFHAISDGFTAGAVKSAKMAGYIRRDQDWTFQVNQASRQVVELDKQLVSADIRIQVAEKELENHLKLIDRTKEVELFIKDKFTNEELYQWMKEQLYAVYKQSYNLAFDMAKKTEKSYQYDLGLTSTNFVQYGYWEDARKGLVAGEKLQLSLRQMEKAYIEENKRELELSKNVSLLRLNPQALLELKNNGMCYVSLPEELFDLDYQGHYFRRLKAVRISIPCLAGPHITVNCSLRLLNNSIRTTTVMNESGEYQHNNDEGILIDDTRFRSSNVPVTAIATSSGQNDSGMFEFNFRDERYLPFEGAGAISEWQLELTTDEALRQFDYDSISDVVMHLSYTARESGGLFKNEAVTYMKDFMANVADLTEQPFRRMFNVKQEFSTAWHRFLYPVNPGDNQELELALTEDHYPFYASGNVLNVRQVDVIIQSANAGTYRVVMSAVDKDDPATTMTSNEVDAPESPVFENQLQMATFTGAGSGVDVEAADLKNTISFKVRHSGSTPDDYTALGTNPDELENMYLIVHYSL